MQEKSLIKKNILQYIDLKGITKYKFYQETGITRGVLDQNNGMSEDNTARILAYYKEINPDWLITGNGPMFRDQLEKVNQVVAVKSTKGIPLLTLSAVAGFGSGNFTISEQDVKDYYVIPKFKYNRVDFMIEIYGSSMDPKFNSGDIVACTIIKEESFIQWNKCYVIATREQGILVKRIKKGDTDDKILAISDNKDYDPFLIPRSEITGIALVIGVIRLE